MGLPIVAPDLPGLDELVTSDTGVWLDVGVTRNTYADAICALAD